MNTPELTYLRSYRSSMTPHQKDSMSGQLLLQCIDELEKISAAFKPIEDWYEAEGDRHLHECIKDAISDLQQDRQSVLDADKLIRKWRRDADQYQLQVDEARSKGLPHDQMLSMVTALRSCAKELDSTLHKLLA